jgi:hypothetical protein
MSSTGNGIHGNILTGGLISATSTITSAANITGGNILTGGLISATGNVTGGNVLTAGLITATGTITSAADITGGNILTGGLISATGNVTGGNVLTVGIMSSTGNITGNNINSTTSFRLPVYANTTVRDSTISSPVAGMMIFVTGTGMQVRGATQWNTITGSGT